MLEFLWLFHRKLELYYVFFSMLCPDDLNSLILDIFLHDADITT